MTDQEVSAYLTWTDASGTMQQFLFDLVEQESWRDGACVTEHPVEQGANISDNVRVALSKCELKVFLTNEPLGSNPNGYGDAALATQQITITPKQFVPGTGMLHVMKWVSLIQERSALVTAAGLAGGLAGSVASGVAAIGTAFVAGQLLPGFETVMPVPTNAGMLPGAPTTLTVESLQFGQGLGGNDFVALAISALQALKDAGTLFTVVGTKQTVDNMVIDQLDQSRDFDTGGGAELTIGFKQIRFVSTTTVPAPIATLPSAKAPVSKGNQNTSDDTNVSGSDSGNESALAAIGDQIESFLTPDEEAAP